MDCYGCKFISLSSVIFHDEEDFIITLNKNNRESVIFKHHSEPSISKIIKASLIVKKKFGTKASIKRIGKIGKHSVFVIEMIQVSRANYFEQETSRSLRMIESLSDRFMWFKIPDTKLLRFKSNIDTLIADPVPCDYIALHGGKANFIECKSSKNPSSYSLRYIKEHQLDYLLKSEKCGGKGWFLINSRKGRGSIRAFAVHPKAVKRWIDLGMKSIKWDELAVESIPLKRMSGGTWDLKPIFLMF